MSKRLCLLFFLAMAVALAAPALAQRPEASSLREKALQMKRNLEKKGFVVREGLYVPWDLGAAYCRGWADTCNLNNHGVPYHLMVPPPLDGQAPTQSPVLFRLRRDEAIVVVGPTPPTCRYYSYTLYLYYRWDPRQGRIRKVFDTFSQSTNQLLLKTGGSAFGKNIVLTFTCDRKVDQDVRDAAKAAGFPGDVLNTYVVPSSALKTNETLDAMSDTMTIVQRTALVTGSPNAENPIVLRVTPATPTPVGQLNPFPAPDLRVRGTGKTETDWTPATEVLRESILARYPGRTPQEYTTIQYLDQSPIAIQSWGNTLAESSDTTYLGTQETFKLSQDPDDFLIVYGVNHAKTEKCLYANLNVYQACALCGVASVFSDDYANTAQDYLVGPQPFDPSYLFAYKIARNCNGDPHCLTVPTSNVCGQGASLNDDLTLGFRAYLEPKTKTGPSYTELFFERVLHFTASPPQVEGLNTSHYALYPGTIPVTLHATSQSPGPLRWQADYEFIDNPCCGVLQPKEGVVAPDGSINLSFTPNRPGWFYVTVTVSDEMNRQTCGELEIVSSSE
jgi:hypothetical protein